MSEIVPTEQGKSTLLQAIQSGTLAVNTMTDQTLADAMDAAKPIKDLFVNIEKEIQRRLTEKLFTDPRYDLGKGNRKQVYKEPEDVVFKKLVGMRLNKSEVMPPTLLTPAQLMKMEKLTDRQRDRIAKELVEWKDGSEKVVRVENPQQTKPDLSTMFLGATEPAPAPAPKLSFM